MVIITRLVAGVSCGVMLTGCSPFLGEPVSRESIVATGQNVSSLTAFPELEAWLTHNMLSITAGLEGKIDYDKAFAQGAVIAYGEGRPSMSSQNKAQKRLTAQRAAEVVAKRNLSDFFAGYDRHGEVRFVTHSVKLEAFLKGAITVASQYDSGSERAAVLLKLDLRRAEGFAP